MLKLKHQFVEDAEKSVFCADCKRPKPHPIHRLPGEDPKMVRGIATPTKQG